ncbi:MAG TPA: autotransporter-associated beta strand repeat-containing protein, partial [Gemmataceae bacterium]|nr:autotransporter-associated beta strand repeat-containing protein [Gemmataceae bacterium]
MGLFGWRRLRQRRGKAVGGARPRLEALEDRLAPATLTWTGALDNLWGSSLGSGPNTLTNWTSSDSRPVAIPQAGDDLVFPAGAANLANNNDISSLSVQSITFQGAGYTLGGNALTLTASLADESATSGNSIQFDLTLPNTVPLDVAEDGETLTLAGAVGGTGGISKSGAGRVTLTGNNDYGGGTDVTAGAFNIQQDTSLGAGPVTVESGAALEIQANLAINPFLNIANAVTLNGSGVGDTGAVRNLSGFNALAGIVTLQSDSTVGVDGGELSLSGPVGGAHGLTKVGVSPLNFSGSAPNTYTGPTLVNSGFVALEKDAGVVAIPGDLVIGNGTGQPGGGEFSPTTVQLETDEQIADASRVTVASDGLLDIDGFSETIGSLSGTGQVNLTNGSEGEAVAGALTVGANNTTTTYAGVITGDGGSLTKVGGGAFVLAGANTYTGNTGVNG